MRARHRTANAFQEYQVVMLVCLFQARHSSAVAPGVPGIYRGGSAAENCARGVDSEQSRSASISAGRTAIYGGEADIFGGSSRLGRHGRVGVGSATAGRQGSMVLTHAAHMMCVTLTPLTPTRASACSYFGMRCA
eukprot:1107880-Rhodomonas_salina.1